MVASVVYELYVVGVNVWLAVAVGCMVYVIMLRISGALRGEDMAIVGRALPIGPLRRWLPA